MRRIAVVGTTGSGKTSLARLIALRLSIPHIELDALHWEPNWTEADSLFLWAVHTYGRNRREYARLPCQPQYAHLNVVRLRSPAHTRTWLATLPRAPG